MLQSLVYVFLLIDSNSCESPLNMAPIFVILTQANVHSLRLVATQLGSHGQFRNVDLSLKAIALPLSYTAVLFGGCK